MPNPYLGYSNFDRAWDDGAKERVEAGVRVTHSAWNFNGTIWKADGLYHEEVCRFGAVVAVHTNTDLEELVREVNDEYGWD